MPRGPLGASALCTISIGLISAGSANMVFGANFGHIGMARTLWTVGCVLAGGALILLFKCHTALTGHAPNDGDRE